MFFPLFRALSGTGIHTISLCDCLLPYGIVAAMDWQAIGEVENPEAATAAESDFKVEIKGFRGFIPF